MNPGPFIARLPSVRARKADLEHARALQCAAMPDEAAELPGFQIAWGWHASPEVGGDYLDVFPLDDRQMAFCVGDVAGKGLRAAELMSELRSAVRRYAPGAGSPAELCTRVNQELCGLIGPARYVTMFYGVIDTTERRLRYESAGHCAPLLMHADGSIEFPASFSGVLGIFSHWLYRDQEVALRAGDCVLLLTDGILQAENRRHEGFGYQRLVKLVEARRGAGAKELSREILAAVSSFCHGRFRDDASLIVVCVE